MFSKKEILFWTFAFTIGIFLAWSCRLEAQETEKKGILVHTNEFYPNFLLHNSTTACIQGVVQLIISYNPTLRNQFIPPAIQQQLIGHCSCIMDNIRKEYTIQEYMTQMNDYLWIKDVWGRHGENCTKAGYLAGLIHFPTDNKTKEDTKVEDNKTESLKPESKVEEIENEEATIFQG